MGLIMGYIRSQRSPFSSSIFHAAYLRAQLQGEVRLYPYFTRR